MFDKYKSLTSTDNTPRPFDPYNEHNGTQMYSDSIGSFGAFKPLTNRLTELLSFYRSNDKEDTSYLGV